MKREFDDFDLGNDDFDGFDEEYRNKFCMFCDRLLEECECPFEDEVDDIYSQCGKRLWDCECDNIVELCRFCGKPELLCDCKDNYYEEVLPYDFKDYDCTPLNMPL